MTMDAVVFKNEWIQESLCQTMEAGVSKLDSGWRSLYLRQRIQKFLSKTTNAVVLIRQRMQNRRVCIRQQYLHETSDTGVSIRKRM